MTDLLLTYDELRRYIGRHIGAGRAEADLSSTHVTDIQDMLVSGLRSFYWPVVNPETGEVYRWSFMDRDDTIVTANGKINYELPTDFSGLTGQFVFADGSQSRPIAAVPEDHLRSLIAGKNETGPPLYCAITSRNSVHGNRTVNEVIFYPRPDDAYELNYRYSVEPLVIDAEHKHPLGGANHAETIIEACLAAADKILSPEAGPQEHARLFALHLQTSIQFDRQVVSSAREAATWPIDAVTDTIRSLEVTKNQLQRLIGHKMGFGANPMAWTHGQAAEISEIVRMGLRRFYVPPVLQGERTVHRWSFLTPLMTLDLVPGQHEYDLPAGFGMIAGEIVYAENTLVGYPNIRRGSEEEVRRLLQYTTLGYIPRIAATRVKPAGSGESGTRWQLLLAPSPSEALQINFPYEIQPDDLGGDDALPLGGQPHGQTTLEACLASMEIYQGVQGIHQQEFLSQLRSSISFDQQVNLPTSLGYSGDASDSLPDDDYHYNRGRRSNHLTTYNGQVYWD